jgi:hypothetical protein
MTKEKMMANESMHRLEWRLAQVAPSEPLADQRSIHYRALPVDDSRVERAELEAIARQYADAINRRDFGTIMGLQAPSLIDAGK